MLYLWTVSWDTGIHKETNSRKIVIYTRVSTSNQKDDLKNQVEFLIQYANTKGIIVDEVIEDYGSGLKYNRKNGIDLLIVVWQMR